MVPLTPTVIRSPSQTHVDSGPLAGGALEVVPAAGVQQFLEIGVVIRPPELAVGKNQWLTPPPPSWSAVGPECCFARDRYRDRSALSVLAANDDQVADTSLGELALDRRHPLASRPAVGAGRVEENARVPYGRPAVGSLAPLVFHDQMIIAVLTFGGDVAESVARDMEHMIGDAKDPARIGVVGILQPCGQTVEVLTVEEVDGRFGAQGLGLGSPPREPERSAS